MRRFSGLRSSGSPFMNSVSRTSRKSSDSVMTWFPTTTATRSTTPATAIQAVANAIRHRISKRLPDREEELKLPRVLNRRLSRTVQELLDRRARRVPVVRRRIEAVRQIHAHRPHRSLVANTESCGLYRVIKIGHVPLSIAERDAAEVRVDISEVVKDYAANVVADQRKTQLRRMKEQRIAAHRETGNQIARTRLVVREAPLRGRAATIESFRQRDVVRRVYSWVGAVRADDAERGIA